MSPLETQRQVFCDTRRVYLSPICLGSSQVFFFQRVSLGRDGRASGKYDRLVLSLLFAGIVFEGKGGTLREWSLFPSVTFLGSGSSLLRLSAGHVHVPLIHVLYSSLRSRRRRVHRRWSTPVRNRVFWEGRVPGSGETTGRGL